MRVQASVLALLFIGLVLPGPAAQAQGSTTELEATDGRGDVRAFGFSPLGLPSSPATDQIDLISLRIHSEDIDGLTIELGVANLKPQPDAADWLTGGQYNVFFTLEGTDIQYTTRFQVYHDVDQRPPPTGVARIGTQFRVCVPSGGCFDQRAIGYVDWDESRLFAYIPKGALAAREPLFEQGSPDGVPQIRAGSRLSSIQAITYGNLGLQDVLPDTGFAGPYVLRAGVPNDKIALSLEDYEFDYGDFFQSGVSGPVADFPAVSVSPGTPSVVQVRVANHNAAKRIVNLSAEVVDPALASKWNLRVVNTLTLPGGTSRIVNLIVNASSALAHGDEALVRVGTRSLGFADEVGSLRLRLVGSVTPTPTLNTLFLHTSDPEQGPVTLCYGCQTRAWMNTLQADPDAHDEAGARPGFYSGITTTVYELFAGLDTPLNAALVLEKGRPIQANLASACSPCPQGTASLEFYDDEGLVASGSAPFAAETELELATTVERIPAGRYLGLVIRVQTTGAPPVVPGTGIRILGEETKLVLPLIPDPEAKKAPKRIPLGPVFLSLSAENSTGQFVAPGKSKVFPVTVVNEGLEEDVITVATEHDPETWMVSITPGTKYRLKSGESATFGVMVRAPANSTEGQPIEVRVNATSDLDPSVVAAILLDATVTENVLEDEEDFEADEDTSLALEDDGKHVPGPGVLVGLVSLGLLVAVLRRRRDQ